MAKTYRPYVPEQDLLLPPSLRDWLPENHLAYFVSDLVDHLDLSAITAVYEEDERGYPPYHPVMLTRLLIYGYCVGVFSSRRIQRRLIEDVAFRVLAAGNEPDFRTIADFRKRHLPALQGFFEQVLGVARDLGTLRVGRIALDGTKVKANASKHKAMSYGRMKDKARQLREEVKQLLAHAEATDAAEDAEYGADVRGDELPAELQRRESRLKRIREATRALKARAKEEAAAAGQPVETAKPDLKPTGKANLFVVFGEPDIEILHEADGRLMVHVKGVDVFDPTTGEVRSDGPDGIACWFIDTDYNEESFFVRHAYFLGQNDPYGALKTTLKAEIDPDVWATLNSPVSRPFPMPKSGRIAVKVINHLGDEVMKVFRVE